MEIPWRMVSPFAGERRGRERRNECLGARSVVTSWKGREPINWIPRSSARIYCIVVEARKGPRSPRVSDVLSLDAIVGGRLALIYNQGRSPGTERIVSSSMKVSCPRRRVIFSRRVSYVIGIRSATELQNRITRRLP